MKTRTKLAENSRENKKYFGRKDVIIDYFNDL